MTVHYELKSNSKMTEKQIKEVDTASKMPIIYDDDSPEMDDAMEKAFIKARKEKPYQESKVMLYLPDQVPNAAPTV